MLDKVALLGTGQTPETADDSTGTAVDDLVARVGGLDRERALLLRAGGLALLRRSASVVARHAERPDTAPEETLRAAGSALAERLSGLFSDPNQALLFEALARMGRAQIRLPEELLPRALSAVLPEVRDALRPVLGTRGIWLSRSRPEWSWATSASAAAEATVADIESRWEEATAREREALLAAARRTAPEVARRLASGSIKNEKAETRLAWLGVLTTNLDAGDIPLLNELLLDRSQQVRRAAARLLWRLPESKVAERMRTRAEALLGGRLDVKLPAEEWDPSWEKDGVVEAAPAGMGRRQFWLAQLLSATHPDHWVRHFELAPERLIALGSAHQIGEALLDGWTAAAVRHDASEWIAPLWDVWVTSPFKPHLVEDPLSALAGKLREADAVPRMLAALGNKDADVVRWFPSPWPRAVAAYFVKNMGTPRAAWTPLLELAATAIPVDLLPATLAVPDVPADYAAHQYLKTLDKFQSVAGVRRAIAKEIPE